MSKVTGKSIVLAIIIFLIIIALLFIHHYCPEWVKLVLATMTGGLLSYCIIWPAEEKRENRSIKRNDEIAQKEKRMKCTTALLSTQMAIMSQMEASKGVDDIVNNILKFNVLDKTLEQHLQNIPDVSKQVIYLHHLIKTNKAFITKLFPLTKHLMVSSISDKRIDLPYEIFEIPSISLLGEKIIASELAGYFQKLIFCNMDYTNMISLINRNNEIRDWVIKQPIEQYSQLSQLISGVFTLSLDLKKMISKYLEKTSEAFFKTAHYIELLGISIPIQVERDKEGKIILDNIIYMNN